MTSKGYHNGRYRSYHTCVVQECKNTSIKTPNKLWISVPSEINRRSTWLKLAKRDPHSFSTKSVPYFCEDHFDLPNDMENYMEYYIMGKVKIIRMKRNCVPTKFECRDVKRKQKRVQQSSKEKQDDVVQRTDIASDCLKEHGQSCGPSTSNSNPVPCDVDTKEETESETEMDFYEDTEYLLSECLVWEVNMADQEKIQDEILDPLPHFDVQSVCRCCLSGARSLRTLGRSQRWVGAALCAAARVCWECAATLRRMHSFRERARTADEILTRAEQTQITSEIKSLSTLTRCTKDTYDYMFEHECSHKPTPHEKQNKYSEIKVEPSEFVDTHNPQVDIKQEQEDTEFNTEIFHTADIVIEEPLVQTTADNASKILQNYGNEEKIKPSEETMNPAKETIKPAEDTIQPAEETINSAEDTINPAEDTINPSKETINSAEDTINPAEEMYTVMYLTDNEVQQIRQRDREKPKYITSHFKCEQCICYFRKENVLRMHKKERHSLSAGKLVCKVCQQRFVRPTALASHSRRHYVAYRCRECALVERNECSMKEHVELHTGYTGTNTKNLVANIDQAENKFVCDECGKEYRVKYAIVRHLIRGSCSTLPAAKPYTFSNPVYSECGICHEKVTTRMKIHLKNHSPAEVPRCLDCNKEFNTQKAYIQHRINMHMPRKLQCQFCDKRFLTKSRMDLHMDMTHIAVLKYKCDVCTKAFASLVALKKHKKEVHDRKFKNLCTYCGVAFPYLNTLREHMRVHTGEKPYQCAHCHCAFAQRSNILSHIKSVHKEVMVTRAHAK